MKIGLFSDTYLPQINGVTTTVHWLREELERLGHEVYVFCPHYGRERPDPRVIRLPAVTFPFHRESRVALPLPIRARRVLEGLEAVHSHTPFSLGTLALWAARRGLPHVHTYHTLYVAYRHYLPPPLRPPRRMAEVLSAAFCNRCDAVTVESTPIRDELLRYGVRVPIHVFPFGVNLRLFSQPIRHDLRKDLGLSPQARLLLYVGRLAQEKNVSFLLRMFGELAKRRPEAVLIMIGGGPAAGELVQQAHRLGIAGRVLFPGYIGHERLVDYYRQADVFVFASKTETQGLVVLEAMAAGLPVVAIPEMGVKDFLVDGVNALCAPEDERGFAGRVMEVLEDRELRERLKEGALATAHRLSSEASTQRLLAVIESLRRG
ncbi:MAG: Glycosyl transferase family 1 [Acetothermia bacterium 64_32]|nr:MAG: Glycosyl transferase family 1 [Acetothermia bacterium 64_32]HAF69784.1 glycosyltransferase family 4 protein [Candidatus Acetothermia bacterium]